MGTTNKKTGDEGKALSPVQLAAEFNKLQKENADLKDVVVENAALITENEVLKAVAEENAALKKQYADLKDDHADPDVIASLKNENVYLIEENEALKAAAKGMAAEKVEPAPKLSAKERAFKVEIVEKLANGEKRTTKGTYCFKDVDAVFWRAKKVLIADAMENKELQEAYVRNNNVLIEKIK